ncbi:PREDICTED: hemicentin-2-like, partial [Vollenhovia emeryi]|uniref:hemicentin-2-like n=1 Tax=Vollenhovia emeryi TaxID=411798 RepID=UPI0005F4D687
AAARRGAARGAFECTGKKNVISGRVGEQTRVTWWRGNGTLADSVQQPPSTERFVLYSNGSLRVLDVQREDSGEYVCQVIRPSPLGHVTQVLKIEVMYPPSAETVPASGELEVNLGERVEMQCVTKGVPAPIISWRTKDREIPLLDERPVLRFHADSRNLSGRYTCVAKNGIGDPAEAHVDLRIRCESRLAPSWRACNLATQQRARARLLSNCVTGLSFREHPRLIEFNYDRPYRGRSCKSRPTLRAT